MTTVRKLKRAKPKMKLDYNDVIPLTGQEGIDTLHWLFENYPKHSVRLEIYPDIAKLILSKYHGKNRRVSEKNKRQVTYFIKKDGFVETGDTIKFSDKDRLFDGQHRLSAIIEADSPMVTHAVFGLNEKLFAKLDQGKNRTKAETLQTMGVKEYTTMATALTLINNYKLGKKPDFWTNEGIWELYKKIGKKVEEHLSIAQKVYKAHGYSPGVGAAISYLISETNPHAAQIFMEDLHIGSHDGRGKNFYKLKTYILNTEKRGQTSLRPDIVFLLLVLTFNSWINDEIVSSSRLGAVTHGAVIPRLRINK